MIGVPGEGLPVQLWLPSPQIWLKSKSLDLRHELRFESGPSDYDSTSWPLRKREAMRQYSLSIDNQFDWNVRNAWFLPWQFSRRRLEPCERRSMANFVIWNIGHWNGDGEGYDAALSALTRPLRPMYGRPVRQVVALTPFSIIAQQFCNGVDPQAEGEIVHTEILFFYTFENFIQEAMARNAHAGGAAPDTIVSAYEHICTNTRPDAVLLRDPSELRLAALTTPDFSWTGIRNHMLPRSLERVGGTAEDRPLWLRETLFHCRLQSHLMVAIAAACHGIASFQQAAYASPLVTPLLSTPTIEGLAPFWLRHLFGTYDHGEACMHLLDSLARRNGVDVNLAADGSIIPHMHPIRTDAEESVAFSIAPLSGQRGEVPGKDSFRWGIFETAIDDAALTTWYQDVCRKFA